MTQKRQQPLLPLVGARSLPISDYKRYHEDNQAPTGL